MTIQNFQQTHKQTKQDGKIKKNQDLRYQLLSKSKFHEDRRQNDHQDKGFKDLFKIIVFLKDICYL